MNGNEKLTLEQELQLCDEYTTTKITETNLAKKYNICNATIANIRKRHNVPRRSKIRKDTIKFNENYFETIDTAAKSYYLGFIGADGCISKDLGTMVIELSIIDEQFLLDFITELKSDHKLYYRTKKLKSTEKTTGKTYEMCALKIARTKFCNDLNNHGVGPYKSSQLSIPSTIPEQFINCFLRGMMDGDGCFHVDKNNIMNITLVSPVFSFLNDVKNIFVKHCDAGNPTIYSKQGCFAVKWGGNLQCRRICEYLYSDNGPRLQRKNDIVKNYLGTTKNLSFGEIENPKIPSELDRLLGFS